jgi:hypothetical protein
MQPLIELDEESAGRQKNVRRPFDPHRHRGWDYWSWHERMLYIITWIMMTGGMVVTIGFIVATFAIIVGSDLTSDVDYLKEMLYLIGQALKQLHADCAGP